MRRPMSLFNSFSLIFGMIFLYIPIIVLIVYSFNKTKFVRSWTGFSLEWYRAVFNDPQILGAAQNSLIIAVVSACIATFLGTLAAVSLTRYRKFRGRVLFSGMVFVPLVIPEVMLGISLALLFISLDIQRNLYTVMIAHATYTLAFVTVIVQARLVSFDQSLEEAARDLGCPPWQVFWKVTLPIISPAVIAGWMLAFTLSLDDVVIAALTSTGTATLPIYILSAARRGISPEINALSSMLIYVVTFVVIIGSVLIKRHASARRRDDAQAQQMDAA